MIHPQTGKIKIIDFGRCQSPKEEMDEWASSIEVWNIYSDEGRLKFLRMMLYNAIQGSDSVYREWPGNEPEDFFAKIKIRPHIENCKRPPLSDSFKKKIQNDYDLNKKKHYN
jgi:hypothetical protein